MGWGRSLTQPCRTPIALLWCLRHMNSVEQCGTVSGACSAGTAGTRGTFLKRRVSVWNSGWVVKPLKPPVCVRSEGAWNTQNTHEHVCKHISYPSTRGNMFIAKRRALWFALVSSGSRIWIRTDGERGFFCCFHPVIVSFNSTVAHILPRHHTTKQILLHHTATLQ